MLHLLTPSNLIATAYGFLGMQGPPELRDAYVQKMLEAVRLSATAPWSAAFVYHVGHRSHYEVEAQCSSWPLPATGDCNALARYAMNRGVLSREAPQRGEVMLLWSRNALEFVRAGIVVRVEDRPTVMNGQLVWTCDTIEGNTSEGGGMAGPWVHVIRRSLCPGFGDRTVRWVDFDGRGRWADPAKRIKAA